MGVYIPSMEMPTSCASCRLAVCFADTGKAKCYATLSYIDPERGKRSYDCPLRPLPEKHGRLIDGDALMKTFAPRRFTSVMGDAMRILDNWPTIVEAEGD